MPTPRLPLDVRLDEVTEVLLVLRQVLREPAFATALVQLVTGNGPKLAGSQSAVIASEADFSANVEPSRWQ